MATSANVRERAPPTASTRFAVDIGLSAITYWYLTGLLAALGFSLGFYLLRPAPGAVSENRDWLDAFTWMDGKPFSLQSPLVLVICLLRRVGRGSDTRAKHFAVSR